MPYTSKKKTSMSNKKQFKKVVKRPSRTMKKKKK